MSTHAQDEVSMAARRRMATRLSLVLLLVPALDVLPSARSAGPAARARQAENLFMLRGHRDRVFTLTFSPDGRYLASVAQDGTLRTWDAATGKEVRRIAAYEGNVYGVAFSPDGRRLATASGGRESDAQNGKPGELKIWDAAAGKELLNLSGHTGPVYGVAFSPDGKRLASGSADHTVRLWDAATGKEVLAIKGQRGTIYCVAFSPDGKRLVSAAGDFFANNHGDLKVWDAATGKELVAFKGHTATVYHAAFSRDGRLLASAGGDHALRIWDAETGRPVRTLNGHTNQVWNVAFAPEGQRVVSAGRDETVRVWDLPAGKEIVTIQPRGGECYSVAFAPDGRRVAAAGANGTLGVWEVTGLDAEERSGPIDATPKRLEALWSDLGSSDPWDANRAVWLLIAVGRPAVAFLKERAAPAVVTVDSKQVARLIADLDAKRFLVRERAARELERLGPFVQADLCRALAGTPSLEARRRMEQLLGKLQGPIPADALPLLRAVAVLEYIATPEARAVLEVLAQGAPAAPVTQEARAALRRLVRRP